MALLLPQQGHHVRFYTLGIVELALKIQDTNVAFNTKTEYVKLVQYCFKNAHLNKLLRMQLHLD